MPFISSVSGNFGPVGRSRRPFNLATGGNSTVDVANYNSTGQLWRVHTFTSSGTFAVSDSPGIYAFRVLVIGGGGGGGSGTNGGGGGAGGVVDTTSFLGTGNLSVTVGSGQSAGQGRVISASGTSSISLGGTTYVSAGGGMGGGNNYGARGGDSGSPQNNAGGYAVDSNKVGGGAGSAANGSPGTTNYGGNGLTTNITGTVSQCFAGGGGGGSRGTGHGVGACGGGSGPSNGGSASIRGSGGAGADFDGSGGSGFRGEVIIAYRIG